MKVIEYGLILQDDGRSILKSKNEFILKEDMLCTSPSEVTEFVNQIYDLEHAAEEYMYIVACNNKSKCIGLFEVGHGTVNSCLLGTREVLVRALLLGAVNIIAIHNHPSGNPKMSLDDLRSTERLKKACDIVGIGLSDHIVVGRNCYESAKEEGII